MKVLLLSGSVRRNSLNRKLALAIEQYIGSFPDTTIITPSDDCLVMPIYDGDHELASGIPSAAVRLAELWAGVDAVILCVPEYNGGIAGGLKNAVDWMSRINPQPFLNKWILLAGASPGALGSVRGLWHTRVPFEALGALVFPEMFGLAHASEAFNEDGELESTLRREQMNSLLKRFLARVS